MIMESLRTGRFVILKDSIDYNVLPVLINVISDMPKDIEIAFFCYDHPPDSWRKILNTVKVKFYEVMDLSKLKNTKRSTAVFIDSFNQMALLIGIQQTCESLKNLLGYSMISKVYSIYHSDCKKSSKLEFQLEHISQLILTPRRGINDTQLRVTMQYKKGGKVVKTTEDLCYRNCVLTASPVSSKQLKQCDVEQVLPHNLTTFKIGLENGEKLARNGLELPYMKKQDTGKVYYEHDAADDWDDEDPDEDLDI